jgi:hypothetical protein
MQLQASSLAPSAAPPSGAAVRQQCATAPCRNVRAVLKRAERMILLLRGRRRRRRSKEGKQDALNPCICRQIGGGRRAAATDTTAACKSPSAFKKRDAQMPREGAGVTFEIPHVAFGHAGRVALKTREGAAPNDDLAASGNGARLLLPPLIRDAAERLRASNATEWVSERLGSSRELRQRLQDPSPGQPGRRQRRAGPGKRRGRHFASAARQATGSQLVPTHCREAARQEEERGRAGVWPPRRRGRAEGKLSASFLRPRRLRRMSPTPSSPGLRGLLPQHL